MSRLTVPRSAPHTVADMLQQLGDIPPERIRLHPAPGTATEQDVIDLDAHEDRLCELVDGILVEKVMGYSESRLAMWLGHLVQSFLDQHDFGILAGEAGMLRLSSGLVRIPDLSFISWERLPNREEPVEPIPRLTPDLAVEVLSESNTKAEMKRKVREYFKAGTRLVWLVDPSARTVQVYTAAGKCKVLREKDTLDGGAVLPGFSVPLHELFARPGRQRKR